MFYGVTWYGGAANTGTVFKLDGSGNLTQLYSFPDSIIGCNPLAAPIVVGHMLYGTTTFCGAGGSGTVFALDIDSGQASVLHSFAANPNGSASPNVFRPTSVYRRRRWRLPDRWLDRVSWQTLHGGSADGGTIYSIDPVSGTFAVVYNFTAGSDGDTPLGGLLAEKEGLYGST